MEKNGYEVKNPLKTRAIAEAKIKTDKIDVRILANLLRSDLLPTSYVLKRETRKTKEIVTASKIFCVNFVG